MAVRSVSLDLAVESGSTVHEVSAEDHVQTCNRGMVLATELQAGDVVSIYEGCPPLVINTVTPVEE